MGECASHDFFGGVCPGGETVLVERIRRGDSRAYELFVARHQRALQRKARYLVWDDALSQDVVQETWLAVIRGIGKFEGRSSLKTWVFKILENRAKTILDQEKRATFLMSEISDEAKADVRNNPKFERSCIRRPVHSPFQWRVSSQESRMMVRETSDRLEKAIRELPPRRRQVLELRILFGHSSQSASRILGITEGNERVLLHRARLALKQAIAAQR